MLLALQGILISIAFLLGAAIILVIACYCMMASHARKLREVRFFVPEKSLFNSEPGQKARIAFVSDLHFPLFTPDREYVISKLAVSDCDSVVISGDLCQDSKGIAEMRCFLQALSEAVSVPVFIVFGNHDNFNVCKLSKIERDAYRAAVEACGDNIRVLMNELGIVHCRNCKKKIFVGGLEDVRIADEETVKALTRDWKREAINEGAELVLLTHNPDMSCLLDDDSASIILCGHTHGGQVYMPFNLEFKLLRRDKLPKQGFKYGYYDYHGKNRMFISCGLGCSLLPIRFRTIPEIVYVHL